MPANPAPAATALKPYNMQPGETSLAYQAFEVYRDMGPGRTLARVSAVLGKSEAFLSRWSFRNGWVSRAEAFDAEAARIASAKSLNDHAEVRARQAELGRVLQAKGAERMAKMDPLELSATEAIKATEAGAKIERDALGIGARVEVTGADGGPVSHAVTVTIDVGEESRMRASGDDGDD